MSKFEKACSTSCIQRNVSHHLCIFWSQPLLFILLLTSTCPSDFSFTTSSPSENQWWHGHKPGRPSPLKPLHLFQRAIHLPNSSCPHWWNLRIHFWNHWVRGIQRSRWITIQLACAKEQDTRNWKKLNTQVQFQIKSIRNLWVCSSGIGIFKKSLQVILKHRQDWGPRA